MVIKKRHTGLRTRFTLLIVGFLFLTFLVIAYFLVRNAQKTDIRNINNDTTAFATLATPQIGSIYDVYNESGSIKIDAQIHKYTNLDSNINNVTIVDLNGNPEYQSSPAPKLFGNIKQNLFTTQSYKNKSGLITQIVVPYFNLYDQHPYSIAYSINSAVLSSDSKKQIQDIVLFSLIGLVLTAIVMREVIYRYFIKPVEEVSKQAITISQGNYEATIKEERQDEIGDLALSVNTMSERLKTDIKSLQEVDSLKNEFINIASHELRTPLTIIKGNVELLHANTLPENIVKPIKGIEDSSDRLANFAEAMLTISIIQGSHQKIDKAPIALELLISPLKDKFTKMATEKGISLTWQVEPPETIVNVAVAYTQGIIKSLLDNAIKFTDTGGVYCRLFLENNTLTISVRDSGKGISPEELSKLFTKFHRGSDILEYNYAGIGIGLYVAKLMAETQGGKIHVSSAIGKGSTFTVTIPQ
jgi:signal transduction histidine kinase